MLFVCCVLFAYGVAALLMREPPAVLLFVTHLCAILILCCVMLHVLALSALFQECMHTRSLTCVLYMVLQGQDAPDRRQRRRGLARAPSTHGHAQR